MSQPFEVIAAAHAEHEKALLQDELDTCKRKVVAATAREFELKAALESSVARVSALQESLATAHQTLAQVQSSHAQDRAFVEQSCATRVRELEMQLYGLSTACGDKAMHRLEEVEADMAALRTAHAELEGRFQAAEARAHDESLRADTAEARASRLDAAVSELRDELSRAMDEARTAALEAERAAGRESLMAERHGAEKASLVRRATEAEERLKKAPAKYAEAIDELRRSCRESNRRLVERVNGIVSREVSLRVVSDEARRLHTRGYPAV